MPSEKSPRGLGRRLRSALQQNEEVFAWVGDPDGATVDVPDTSNQVWIRLFKDSNQTYPAFNLTGITFIYDDQVWVKRRGGGQRQRGDYWIIGEYTATP